MTENNSTYTSIMQIVNSTVSHIEKVFSNKRGEFHFFSNIVFTFNKEDLIFLGGRQSIGKTALALSLLRNFSINQKKRIGYISCTGMSNEELGIRLISQESGIQFSKVRKGFMNTSELEILQKSCGKLFNSSIYFTIQPNITFKELELSVRGMQEEQNIDILFIDSFDFIYEVVKSRKLNKAASKEDYHWVASQIMKKLKQLATELHISIVIIGEVPVSEKNNYPSITDFSPDMNIFDQVDKIMFLHRNRFIRSKNKTDAKVIMGYNRDGLVGYTNISFVPSCIRFDFH